MYEKEAFDAIGKALMICINAVPCPTCSAMPGGICHSKSGKIVPHHATRTHAGHKLLGTSVEKVFDAYARALPNDQVATAIERAMARARYR